MARKKKSRKVGQIGVPKSPETPAKSRVSQSKPKKKTGNTAGSRHSAAQENNTASSGQTQRDPRVGSKKPIPLVVEKSTPAKTKPRYFSPAQELEAIENDRRLAALLDKQEADKALSQDEQAYLDEKLARHKVLCDLLGINDEEDPQEDTEPDLFEQLNQDHLTQYKQD